MIIFKLVFDIFLLVGIGFIIFKLCLIDFNIFFRVCFIWVLLNLRGYVLVGIFIKGYCNLFVNCCFWCLRIGRFLLIEFF